MKKQRWRFVPVCIKVFVLVLTGVFLVRVLPGPEVVTDRPGTRETVSPEKFYEPVYPIDINTATEEDLSFLPGIGPVTARAIAAHRQANGPFESPTELLEVTGIGEAKLRQLLPYITTGG